MTQHDGHIVVTGADGFVGRYVVAHWRRAGQPVRGLARTLAGTAGIRRDLLACGDLATVPPARLEQILRGARAVVHLAGRVHVMHAQAGDEAERHRHANVEVTRRLAEAAAKVGVARFVFVSTIKVNGERTLPGRPFCESDPPDPRDFYARSKWRAERALHAIADDTGLAVTILRPPLIYGADSKGNFARLVRAVRSGMPLPVGAIANRRSLLYVGNLASAIDAILARPARKAGAVDMWLVADRVAVSTPELVRAIAATLRVPARVARVPLVWLRTAAAITRRSGAFARLVESLEIDASTLRAATGWEPPYTLAEGLREALQQTGDSALQTRDKGRSL